MSAEVKVLRTEFPQKILHLFTQPSVLVTHYLESYSLSNCDLIRFHTSGTIHVSCRSNHLIQNGLTGNSAF